MSTAGHHSLGHPQVREIALADELPLGAHLITPRLGYLHHGVFVGSGRVIHYAGLSFGLRGGPVEEVPLERFARGRPVAVQVERPSRFEGHEIARRARSRLGERRYRLLTNNCEHFCEWCLRGRSRSYQVERLLSRPVAGLAQARQIVTWLARASSDPLRAAASRAR